jgi:hypothetical protein
MADNDKYSSLVLARLEPTRVDSLKSPLEKYYTRVQMANNDKHSSLMPARLELARVNKLHEGSTQKILQKDANDW